MPNTTRGVGLFTAENIVTVLRPAIPEVKRLSSARTGRDVGPTPDQAPHRGLVRRFLRGAVPLEKRVPVANAIPRTSPTSPNTSGLAQDSILEQVFGWRGPKLDGQPRPELTDTAGHKL